MSEAANGGANRKIVLETGAGADAWDIELPANVTAYRLIGRLVREAEFGLRANDDNGSPIPYRLLWHEGQRYLGETETLADGGVLDGHKLVVTFEARAGFAATDTIGERQSPAAVSPC